MGEILNVGPGNFGALTEFKLVDLSHPVSPSMPAWPGDPPVEFVDWATIEQDNYYLRRFSLGEHSGTHLTAPASFFAGLKTVDHYRSEELIHPAVVIDIRERCARDTDYALTISDVTEWESSHGRIPTGSLALLMTGWSQRWAEPANYLGKDTEGGLHFPAFGLEAAELLVRERSIAGLGTDTAGPEPGVDDLFSVSRLALSRNLIVLENLTNLERVPAMGAGVVIGILKLVGGSGSPAAVMAFVPT